MLQVFECGCCGSWHRCDYYGDCRNDAERFADMEDAEERLGQEVEERPWVEIDYECPECGHKWIETWDCACDSECTHCGLENITALDYREV